jgi:uncharacterized membrane protein
MKHLIPLGIIFIFLGVIIITIGAITSTDKNKTDVKFGFGGFIGFIPFGFANDKRFLYFSLGLAFLIFVCILLNLPR